MALILAVDQRDETPDARPAVCRIAVGEGFGLSMGGGAWTDIGKHVGSMLNPSDFGAFARTSKAAYAASPAEAWLQDMYGIDVLAARQPNT